MIQKKILITGASGFIGGFLVSEALGNNYITWAGIRKNSSKEYLADENIQFIDLNFSNKETLKQQIEQHVALHGKWDYIIHNAGITKALNPEDFEKINCRFTINLIDALSETGNTPEKFVLMSSLSATLIDSAYGLSKLKAEQYLESVPHFPYIILRPTGVYGPREKDYLMLIKTIRAGFDISVGFKTQHLTFIYVKDLVRVAFLALKSPLSNNTYNVSDGCVLTDKDVTQVIKTTLNKRFVIRIKLPLFILKLVSVLSELISGITKKPSTLNRDKYKIMKHRDWDCDIQPLKDDLNFYPEYNLTQGMKETVKWYRSEGWM